MEQALIIDAVVLLAVMEADIGQHRKISKFRVLRPLVLAVTIVPIYLKGVTTTGTGLTLEVALTAAGVLLGLAAVALMTVYRSPQTTRPVSRAGWGYALLWIAVIGARALFTIGSAHWFGPQLAQWMARNSVPAAALTDALIFMAIAMLVTRTLGMVVQARRLPASKPNQPIPQLQEA